MTEKQDDDHQLLLPLDERFRQPEQYALDLEPQQKLYVSNVHVCIGNCSICPRCDGG